MDIIEKLGIEDIPTIKKINPIEDNLQLIPYSFTKLNDTEENRKKGVHFFIDDKRFNSTFTHTEQSLEKVLQYRLLCSPDFSLFGNMDRETQIANTVKNRTVGVRWQEQGQTVIPTISWSGARSFDFCFKGVEVGSVVAVGMIGCRRDKRAFMRGYDAMLEILQPTQIIVYGKPFEEMDGNLLVVDYKYPRQKEAQYGR